MQVNSTGIKNISLTSESKKVERSKQGDFGNTLLNKIKGTKNIYDTYEASKQTIFYPSEDYNNLIHNIDLKKYTDSVKPIETKRYTIEELEGGYLRIYDKERKEGFKWKLGENQIQVDKVTGTKFLINDWGSGFFNMVTVDVELENGLKEALGVDSLEESELTGFTVHQDEKTGIKYITANGYESRGGLLVLDEEAKRKLDALAKEYLNKYPNILKSYDEAWFYASFEVRGMVKQLEDGILMIGPNNISYKSKDRENTWVGIIDLEEWKILKEEFDRNSKVEQQKYWEHIFMKHNIERV